MTFSCLHRHSPLMILFPADFLHPWRTRRQKCDKELELSGVAVFFIRLFNRLCRLNGWSGPFIL
jgi:hypothetical protein